MSQISTHILDTSLGQPAKGIPVTLEIMQADKSWQQLYYSHTNEDGRINGLLPDNERLSKGIYKITFDTGGYFKQQGKNGFYPYVTIIFEVHELKHHHVPLLISPFGYSTYRGS